MKIASLPPDEAERLGDLRGFGVLDTLPEREYDDLTFLAREICDTPMSVISLVDHDRQWFKSCTGIDAAETPRDVSFCAHAILQPAQLMEVPDATQDPRFHDNPLVVGDLHIRFYAGVPLVTPRGHAIGTICVLDHAPRRLDEVHRRALSALGRQVVTTLELRRAVLQLQSQFAQASEKSLTDELTGLGNRREFDNRLAVELERSTRAASPLSLALLDLDHFKAYNDQFGHQAGDEALRDVAALLGQGSRQSDLAARYGGEEFAIIMPHTPADGAWQVIERIRLATERLAPHGLPLSLSAGIATTNGDGASPAALIEEADLALYEAKAQGRNQVRAAPSPGADPRIDTKLTISPG